MKSEGMQYRRSEQVSFKKLMFLDKMFPLYHFLASLSFLYFEVQDISDLLTHFMAMVPFDTPRKHQKTKVSPFKNLAVPELCA